MTDQFVTCPDCHVLVENTTEERREHRAVDRQNRTVLEAIRRTVRGANDDAASALQLVRDLQHDLEGLDGRLRTTEDAPDPEPVLVGTWPEDELDDPDEPEQTSQYADEDLSYATHDDVDEPTADTGNIRQIRNHVDDYFTGPGGGAA